jgi:hypothetical protein
VGIVKSKTCTICKEEKALSLFNKRGGREPGYRSFCKQCQSKKDAVRYNPQKRKDRYMSNHEEEKQKRKEYYKSNVDKYYVNKARRRASLLQATPKWYDSFDDFVLSEAHSLCKLREETTGIKWEVDHVVPLQGKTVCGLHWHQNWSVIPMFDNRSKGNQHSLL